MPSPVRHSLVRRCPRGIHANAWPTRARVAYERRGCALTSHPKQSDSHLERPKEIHGACAAALWTGARWALSAPWPHPRPLPHAMRRSRTVGTARQPRLRGHAGQRAGGQTSGACRAVCPYAIVVREGEKTEEDGPPNYYIPAWPCVRTVACQIDDATRGPWPIARTWARLARPSCNCL